MTEIISRSYGFKVELQNRAGGGVCVVAYMLAREGSAPHPINPDSDVESAWRGAPKRSVGLALDGLSLLSWRSSRTDDAGVYEVYSPELTYCNAGTYLGPRKVEAMARTMAKISKAIEKAKARDAGDMLLAVAAATGASWLVTEADNPDGWSWQTPGGFYSSGRWRFSDLAAARDAIRRAMVAAAKP